MNQLASSSKYPDLGRQTTLDRVVSAVGKRYFGGRDIPTAIETIRGLNGKGIDVIVDLLGEKGNSSGSVKDKVDKTTAVCDAIAEHKLRAAMAVRLGQFDDQSWTLLEVMQYITSKGIFVWLDPEYQRTLATVHAVHEEALRRCAPGMVGMAHQGYLAEALTTLARMIDFSAKTGLPINIRPVRGVYVKDADIRDRLAMHRNLARMMEMLATCGVSTVFEHPATHEPAQVARVAMLKRWYPDRVKALQYLQGICSGPMVNVARENDLGPVMYLPIGPAVAKYGWRRITETGNVVAAMFLAQAHEERNADIARYLINNAELAPLETRDHTLPFVLNAHTARRVERGEEVGKTGFPSIDQDAYSLHRGMIWVAGH